MLDESPSVTLDMVLADLNAALAAGDVEAAVNLFQDDCYWRDLAAITWNLKTVEGKAQVRDMLTAQLGAVKPQGFAQAEGEVATQSGEVTEGWIRFETETGRGCGQIRLKNGKIWTLLTALEELKGHEEPRGLRRPMGAEHGHDRNRKTWSEKRAEEAAELGYKTQPYVLVIGGGQGGIALGARLRQMGV
jgi:putative flavoprotein involved in K+ transport